MIDFPASPTVGQEFTGGTVLYRYNGYGWAAVAQAGQPYVLKTGDTMSGQLVISPPAGGGLVVSTTSDVQAAVHYFQGGLSRWSLLSQSNTADFLLTRSNASGVFVDTPFVARFATGKIEIGNGITSTSPTTGALVVSGGVGIGGALHLTGTINLGNGVPITWKGLDGIGRSSLQVYDNNVYLDDLHTGNIYFRTGPTVGVVYTIMSITSAGQVQVNSSTASSSSTTGALVVTGGVGVGGSLNVGSSLGSNIISINGGAADFPGVLFLTAGVMKWKQVVSDINAFILHDADASHGVQLAQNTTAWVAFSDGRMRHKQNARTVSGLLNKLDRFRLIEYGQDHSQVGVIAQELHAFMPQLTIHGDDDEDRVIDKVTEPDVWVVKPSEAAFVAMQIGKELNERINALERQLKEKH